MPRELKLDLGCGTTCEKGFTGVDIAPHKGVKHVADLTQTWAFKDNSVDEVRCRNVLNYLTAEARIHFVNELCRVLKTDAKALFITPHWCSNSAFGDLGIQWPPVAESWYFYLRKDWREANAPWEKRYTCDFDSTGGYEMHPHLVSRNQEYQQHAITFWKEAAPSLIVTLTKR